MGIVMNVYGGRTIDRIADTHDDAEMERLVILYLMLFKPSPG